MAKRPLPEISISNFLMGTAIPKERVGFVLEQIFLNGGKIESLEGLVDPPPPKPPRALIAQEHAAPLALPPPSRSNGHAHSGSTKKLSVKAWTLKLIEEKGPLSRTAIIQHAKLAGRDLHQIGTAVWALKKDKTIIQNGELVSLAADKAKTKRNSDIVLALIRTSAEPIETAPLREALEAAGRNPDSLGGVLHHLVGDKQIVRVGRGRYKDAHTANHSKE